MPGVPRATYRLQLTPDFGFEQAAGIAAYLKRLGISHLYCSPYLQTVPGSRHGYDIVDHSRVNQELGGEEGHRHLSQTLAELGLGQVLDIVPNHMAIDGRRNRWWWDVLEHGPSSRFASYFDVSWDPPERRLRNAILVPVIRPRLPPLLRRQQPGGFLDGVRIDHPDGLRDPLGYFRRLRGAAPGAWIVAEKVVLAGEEAPREWPIAGTTGYEFLNLVLGLFVDGEGEQAFSDIYVRFTGDIAEYADIVYEKKQQAMRDLLGSDLNRLADLFVRVCEGNRRYRDFTRRELLECLTEAIACLPVYRTYVRPEDGSVSGRDGELVEATLREAARRRPGLDGELVAFLGRLLLLSERGEDTDELVSRFQQTSGPVIANGVEDGAFYAYTRMAALNEVGGVLALEG